MEHFKRSLMLFLLLTLTIRSQTFAQSLLVFDLTLKSAVADQRKQLRAQEVIQDNEYTSTGFEEGHFYDNPLILNGMPLDYGDFGLVSTGELRVVKGSPANGDKVEVPFFLYLRRNGAKVPIPGGEERCDAPQNSIEIWDVLQYAEPGDDLIIEPARKEDGPAKRILRILGC